MLSLTYDKDDALTCMHVFSVALFFMCIDRFSSTINQSGFSPTAGVSLRCGSLHLACPLLHPRGPALLLRHLGHQHPRRCGELLWLLLPCVIGVAYRCVLMCVFEFLTILDTLCLLFMSLYLNINTNCNSHTQWADFEPIMGAKYHTVHHTHYHYNFGQVCM